VHTLTAESEHTLTAESKHTLTAKSELLPTVSGCIYVTTDFCKGRVL
jgi:hypothetical protein